jgi:HEAT repeat protein
VEDKNMLVRSNAVMILANRPEQVAVEAMIQAMKDREYVVKSSATVKLASRGKEILDRMISALEDSDDEIRAGAAWVLGEVKDKKAVEPLRKASQDENPVVRIQAKASLMAMGLLNKEAKEAPGS